eukprot:225786-Prorocentrum_minimum.AAC.1
MAMMPVRGLDMIVLVILVYPWQEVAMAELKGDKLVEEKTGGGILGIVKYRVYIRVNSSYHVNSRVNNGRGMRVKCESERRKLPEKVIVARNLNLRLQLRTEQYGAS